MVDISIGRNKIRKVDELSVLLVILSSNIGCKTHTSCKPCKQFRNFSIRAGSEGDKTHNIRRFNGKLPFRTEKSIPTPNHAPRQVYISEKLNSCIFERRVRPQGVDKLASVISSNLRVITSSLQTVQSQLKKVKGINCSHI